MNIKSAFAYLKNYIDTYPDQLYWERYDRETWINDILYGLGVSLGEASHTSNERDIKPNKNPYSFADGFEKFKLELIERFDEEGLIEKYQETKK